MHDRILRSEIYSICGFSFQVFELITRQNGKDLNLIYSLPKKTLSKGNCIYFGKHFTVELQWLKHLWDHKNMFETGIVQANEC